MSRYFAEIDGGIVQRVIVADSAEWCVEHLGGTWVETADPYQPAQTVAYAGPGHGYDPDWPQRFAPQWAPRGPQDEPYPPNAVVAHRGKLWRAADLTKREPQSQVPDWVPTPPNKPR